MMRGARNYYGARGAVLATVLGVIVWGAGEYIGRSEARALRDRLLSAKIAEVPAIVNEMGPYRHWVNPLLHEAQVQAEADQDSTKNLSLRLALLSVDAEQADQLYQSLLEAKPDQFAVIREALLPHKEKLSERLWAELTDQSRDPAKRFRAASRWRSTRQPMQG